MFSVPCSKLLRIFSNRCSFLTEHSLYDIYLKVTFQNCVLQTRRTCFDCLASPNTTPWKGIPIPTTNPNGSNLKPRGISRRWNIVYIYDIYYDSVILCLYVYDCICIIMCIYLHIPRSGFIYRTDFQGLPNQHGLLGCQTPKHQNNKSVHNLNQQEDHTSRQTVQQLVFWKCSNLRFPYASCNKYNIPYIYIYICIHAEDHK